MRVNVVCCFDNNLALQAAIMATSIARNSSVERPTTLHAYHTGAVTAFDPDALARELKSRSFELSLHAMENPFDSENSIAHANPSYYLRLAMIDQINSIDKLIYLDVDLLVQADLSRLLDVDLGLAPLAAACDIGVEQSRRAPRRAQNIFLSSVVLRDYANSLLENDAAHYFNSGVLVIQPQKWRDSRITERCLEFIQDSSFVLFADQDALNFVLRGNFTPLDRHWNFIPQYSNDPDALRSAGIVHYAGFKPWSASDLPQMGDQAYWEFAMSTPFGEELRSKMLSTVLWQQENGLSKIPQKYRSRWWTMRRRLRL